MNHIRLEEGFKSMDLMGKEIERGVLLIWLCFRVDRKMSDPLLHKGPLFRCRFHKWQQLFFLLHRIDDDIFFGNLQGGVTGRGMAITLIFSDMRATL